MTENPLAQKSVISYLRNMPFGSFARIDLVTTSGVAEEVMQSFRLYADVKDFGVGLLNKNGHTKPAVSFVNLQALLRQAVSFFEAAQQMHYRASPLLYYYSFLNAVKAVAFANNPDIDLKNLMHGLSVDVYSRNLEKCKVSFKRRGVFDLIYKQVYGSSAPVNNSISIAKLMSYVAGVSHEYSTLGMGSMQVLGCRLALGAFAGEEGCRGLVAVEAGVNEQQFASKILTKKFSRVNVHDSQSSVIFGIEPIRLKVNSVWETNATFALNSEGGYDINAVSDYILKNLRHNISFCPNKTDFIFRIHKHVSCPKKMAINETLSIYIIIFFLGSCVRYRPEILEQMLNKKSAWLIEAFMRVAPLAFMRQTRNLLDGQYLAYTGE